MLGGPVSTPSGRTLNGAAPPSAASVETSASAPGSALVRGSEGTPEAFLMAQNAGASSAAGSAQSSAAGSGTGTGREAPASRPRDTSKDSVRENKDGCSQSATEATFRQTVELLLSRHLDNSLTREMLYHAAIQGMLERVSPESQNPPPVAVTERTKGKEKGAEKDSAHERPSNLLLDPSERQGLERLKQGLFFGVGLWLDTPENQGYYEITRVMRGSPAETVGMRAADRIILVNGQAVGAKRSESKRREAKSDPNRVQFTVLRGADRLEFSVNRREFTLEAAQAVLLPPDIGLIDFEYLSARAPQQTAQLVQELKSRKVRGLILDLRGSYGGDQESIRQILELFVPRKSLILQIQGREGNRIPIYTQTDPLLSVPMVLVVDQRTSESAEAMAAALSETTGARIVGRQTAGKATLETLFPLEDGHAALISTGQMYAPSGRTWQGSGLLPDIPAITSVDDWQRAQMAKTVDEKLRQDSALRAAVNVLIR